MKLVKLLKPNRWILLGKTEKIQLKTVFKGGV